MFKKAIPTVIVLITSSCYRVDPQINPRMEPVFSPSLLSQKPSAFPSLSDKEKKEEWASEYHIGLSFAKELDLYRAITSFKRASFLLPSSAHQRKDQISYDILLGYYLGKKYGDVIDFLERSSLRFLSSEWAGFHDLLVISYDSYRHLQKEHQANQLLSYVTTIYPETADQLSIGAALSEGNGVELSKIATSHSDVSLLLETYEKKKKSIRLAQIFNGILPGAGYFYIGQIPSGLTALLINGLSLWAAISFFQQKNIAAGILFSSIEAGWYFGGIYGAGLGAKFYNEQLYERYAKPLMQEKKYFPIFSLQYGF